MYFSILCNKAYLCSSDFGSSAACIFSRWSAYKNLTELGSLTRFWNYWFFGSATHRSDKLHCKKNQLKYFFGSIVGFSLGSGLGSMDLALALTLLGVKTAGVNNLPQCVRRAS